MGSSTSWMPLRRPTEAIPGLLGVPVLRLPALTVTVAVFVRGGLGAQQQLRTLRYEQPKQLGEGEGGIEKTSAVVLSGTLAAAGSCFKKDRPFLCDHPARADVVPPVERRRVQLGCPRARNGNEHEQAQ